MRHVVVCGCTISFQHYLLNIMIFGKNVIDNKTRIFFSVQHLPETFLILRRVNRDSVINVHTYSCKVPVILVRF
jgi:hypothetical protein